MSELQKLEKGLLIRMNRLSRHHREFGRGAEKRNVISQIREKTGILERVDEDGKIWVDFGFHLYSLNRDDDFEIIENNPVVAVQYSPQKGWDLILKDDYDIAMDLLHDRLGSPVESVHYDGNLLKHDVIMWISETGKLQKKQPSFVVVDRLGGLIDTIVGEVLFLKFTQDGHPTDWKREDIDYLRSHFLNSATLQQGGKEWPVKIIVGEDRF